MFEGDENGAEGYGTFVLEFNGDGTDDVVSLNDEFELGYKSGVETFGIWIVEFGGGGSPTLWGATLSESCVKFDDDVTRSAKGVEPDGAGVGIGAEPTDCVVPLLGCPLFLPAVKYTESATITLPTLV